MQRQADKKTEEELSQTKEPSTETTLGHSTPEVTADIESDIHALKGAGRPLPDFARDTLESRIGHNLGPALHIQSKGKK